MDTYTLPTRLHHAEVEEVSVSGREVSAVLPECLLLSLVPNEDA